MTDCTETFLAAARFPGEVAAERVCLRCKAMFWSEGCAEPICPHCRRTSLWRSNVPFSGRQGWRRASGRAW